MMSKRDVIDMIIMTNPQMATLKPLLLSLIEDEDMGTMSMKPKKKRSTAYQRRYKAAFKKIQKRYKLKNGKWKKNGFKAAVKEAHKMAKKGKGRK
jgi:hypothetical protein